MPVILPPDIISDWLNPEYNANEILESALNEMSYMAV